MATLRIIHGVERGRRFGLDQPVTRIGRDASATIQVADSEISRQHAEIRLEKGGYTIVDLVSSNGTFVNGRRVTESRLNPGDRIQLGQTVFIFGTGVGVTGADLAKKISMITRAETDRSSAIVKSFSHAEGSQYLSRRVVEDAPWLKNALAHLQLLYDTSQAVSHIVDQPELLKRILELTFESVRAERGCILLGSEPSRLECAAVHYAEGVNQEEQIEVSRTIVEYVFAKGEGVRTSDAAADDRFTPGQSIFHHGIREAICVPMPGRHGMMGVIYLDNRTPLEQLVELPPGTSSFSDDHLKLVIAIGHQAALAVEDTRYYEAMVQSERLAAVGQTIALLSHHIKNILQGIKGGSHLLEMGLNDHDENTLRRGWNIVNKNQNKIYNLVMDMLTYSKEREPAFETANVNEVVGEVVELMEPRAAERGVTLRLEVDEAVPAVSIDPEGIHRAVLNIVTNALDATEQKQDGRVEVSTKHDSAQCVVRVHVRDNGVGIPREELPHIFGLFASSKGARGTGIGLAVSDKIVREHGGRIHVTSQPGEGTEFVIELPARAEGATMM